MAPIKFVPLSLKYLPQHRILGTSSAYVPRSMSATKFHTHTKEEAKL